MNPKKYELMVKTRLFEISHWKIDGDSDEEIAKKLNISYSAFRNYIKEYEELYEALKFSKEITAMKVEDALLKRALGYTYNELIKERITDSGQKKRHTEGEIKLTENQWQFALDYFNNECCYCGIKTSLTKDHIIPLNKGGKFVSENIIPCCAVCNSSKHDNNMEQWYKKQSFYDEYKLIKIYEYIKLVYKQNSHKVSDDLVITKVVSKQVVPDTTAQIFWLKNRRPDKWRDKVVDNQSSDDSILKDMLEGIKNGL